MDKINGFVIINAVKRNNSSFVFGINRNNNKRPILVNKTLVTLR